VCGVTGWVDFRRDLGPQRDTAAAMTATLACRGPDAEGLWIDRHAALGHRRLAVIDPAGGQQPMCAEHDRRAAVVSFCGEIYNFRSLRTALTAAGHQFRTRSDTEVLLRGYLHWGAAVVDRLDGMFAFAIWDSQQHTLLLARDRLGVKPLYYQEIAGGVLFGSEPKAILANPFSSRRVDASGLCEVLDMVATPGRTVFADMREVRPGCLLRVTRSGVRENRYWQLQAGEHTDDLPTTIQAVRNLLTEAVSRQLVADVPVGVLLSGGLDSSAVAALAARADTPPPSFSVGFGDTAETFSVDAVRGTPDTPFAWDVAKHVGCAHTEIQLNSDELTTQEVHDAVLRATDSPPAFWGDMWPSLYLLCRAVRGRCTVALSGEAADELFGGYRWFHNTRAIFADTFPWLTSGSVRYFGGTSLLDRKLLDHLDIPAYRAARYQEALAEAPTRVGETDSERKMRTITYLNLTRFLRTLLDRKDRMSMAVGLEIRVPYCDHRLVEYVFNVPWSMKTANGREKSLLRAAVGDLLPHQVLDRAKNPYPAIQHPAYEQALRNRLGAVAADRQAPVHPLLDHDRLQRALRRPARDVSMPYDRGGIEMALWLDAWLRAYDIVLDV
jgi:asparagine synthase (glutamine-hydrolysing)